MSHIPFTVTAYFFNAAAILIDKFLLTDHIKHPLTYVFYISMASLFTLVVIPFAAIPTLHVFVLASISTVLWTTGCYFLYMALRHGSPSRVAPIIGTLIPLILLITALFSRAISSSESLGVLALTAGLVFLTLPDWKGKFTSRELGFEGLSALFFAISYIILREAYLRGNFLTVLGWSRIIIIPLALIILAIPITRVIVLAQQKSQQKFQFFSKIGLLFAAGRLMGGVSETLLTFSVSLANPALVNTLQGSQYGFLFLGNLLLARKFPKIFHEKLDRKKLASKIIGILCIGLGLFYMQ